MTEHDRQETRKILREVRRQLARNVGPLDGFDSGLGEVVPLLRRIALGEGEAVLEEVGPERFGALLVVACGYTVGKYVEEELRRLEDEVTARLGEVNVEDDD